MDRLVSKIFAGGLSAGVFLLWWPEHVHGEGLMQLVLRGLLWTLTFELLLLAFGPAETLIAQRLRARTDARRDRVRDRLAGVPAPARTGGVLALACCGIAGPLALLADAPREIVKQVDRPRVVKQVIVERPVVEKKVIVRKVVAPAAAGLGLQSAGAAPSVAGSQVTSAAARKTAKVAPERTAAMPTTVTRTALKTTAKAPAPTTTPAPTSTTPASDIGTPASGTQTEAAPAPATATP
jgi:hypothetical protein